MSADVIAKAQAGEATIELHDSCLQDIPAFAALEQVPASSPDETKRTSGSFVIFSWNAERL